MFKKKVNEQNQEKEIVSERISVLDSSMKNITVSNQKITDLLSPFYS